MKKVLSLILALVMILSTATVLSASVAAETEAEPAGDASLSVNYASLVLEANVKMVYAVQATNIDITTTAIKLLVWDAAPESYTDGSQKYTVESNAKQTIEGVDHVIFEFTDLGAINMADYYYAVACATIGEETVYSAPLKYSVLEYAYTILGKNGGEAYDDANLLAAIEAMLDYGAAMQTLRGYKTDALANGAFSYIEAENAVMADGYSYGICKLGEEVTLTANVPDGKLVHNWVDGKGNKTYSSLATLEVTAPATDGETATYTPVFQAVNSNNDFVYELPAILSTVDGTEAKIKVDGVKDAKYDSGIYLPSFHISDNKTGDKDYDGTTYDMYITADANTVYVYYHINKQSEIFYNAEYGSRHHLDNIDFCLNLAAGASIGKEFHILGVTEGGVGTAEINSDPAAAGVTDYYVKHDDEGNGYSVEFAFPISSITGTDGTDPMFSFTAIATVTYDWKDASKSPSRAYVTAYKAAMAEAKTRPSYVVLKSGAAEHVEQSTHDATTAIGNWIYEVEKSDTALTVDGTLDEAYLNGVVLRPERNLPTSKAGYEDSKATFDVFMTADDTHVYVFYAFVKPEGIFYDADFAATSNYFQLDCVDFVLGLKGQEAKGTEFHILGGVEGAKGTAAIGADPANAGVDNWYVKHTHNGYNVEFSIPLEKILGTYPATGERMLSFTALSTITLGGDPSAGYARVYTCASKASTATGEDKDNPSFLVIKDDYQVEGMGGHTDDGRYSFTLEAGLDYLEIDGVRDEAYDNGITFTPMYTDGVAENLNDKNTFEVTLTANGDYVYILYEVKDDNIVYNAEKSYWYDCADVIISTAANATEGTGADMRIFGITEGDSSTAIATGKHAAVSAYYVKHTDVGYNVEIRVDRAKFTDRNVFSFLAMTTLAPNTSGRTYVYTANSTMGAGNPAKGTLNEIRITAPSPMTADGRYAYTLNAGTEALTVDGVMDGAYAEGLAWEAIYSTPASLADGNKTKAYFDNPEANTFTVYMAADAAYVYVLYVVKDEYVVGADNASAWYRGDCADFLLGVNAEASNTSDIRIFGNIEGGKGTADARSVPAAITDHYVKHTDVGYNVEFKIDRAQFANADVFSFLAMGGACATDKTETGDTNTTVYPCIPNGAFEGGNPAKAKLNQVTIVDAQ